MIPPSHAGAAAAPSPENDVAAWHDKRKKQERLLWLSVVLLVASVCSALLFKHVVITISAGHHGVMFHRLTGGTDTRRLFGEGLYIVAPWNQMVAYETRLQTRTLTLKVPSEEALEMEISVALRFRPYLKSLGHLHKDIGPEYFDRLILPEVHGHLRKVLGKRRAQDIYTGAQDVQQELARVPVLPRLPQELDSGNRPAKGEPPADPYVLLEELRVLDIVRPSLVADAVNEKQRQEQLSLEYKHRLQREQQEAERKRVEANGISDFTRIAGIDILKWRGIDATLELARSNNAKVVVIGNGPGGQPMLLNLGDAPATPRNDAAPASGEKTRRAGHDAD